MLPQFALGSDGGKPDFIVVSGQSNSFWVHVVELKLPTVKRFTDKDMPSMDLRNDMAQVDGYSRWIDDNMDYFKSILLNVLPLHL